MSEVQLPPLIVDLDGTLVLEDTSWRAFVIGCRSRPLQALGASLAYAGGRAAGKRAFARFARPKASDLPYRGPLLTFLHREKTRGRTIHLATGADQAAADEVAAHLGLFQSARGSDGIVNLKSRAKLAWMRARFPDGFDYVGNSAADLPIWRAIRRAMLVGPAINFASRLRREGVVILATI